MSLVTPTYAIPYLTPGDRMAAIPAVDKAQSMRVEELLKTANVPPGNPDLNDVLARLNVLESEREDTGWVNCPLFPGVAQQGVDLPQVRRIGKRVQMRWGVGPAGLSTASTTDVFTIPLGFRPPAWKYFHVSTNSLGTIGRSVVKDNGVVQLGTNTSLGSYYIWDGCSWLTD